MLQRIFNFLVIAGFVLLLPAFWLAAQLWGSPDERSLMRICMIVLSPFCVAIVAQEITTQPSA